jgi:hypothetical protein
MPKQKKSAAKALSKDQKMIQIFLKNAVNNNF